MTPNILTQYPENKFENEYPRTETIEINGLICANKV